MTLPAIYVGARRRWLGELLATGLLQSACVIAAAVLVQRTLDGVLSGEGAVTAGGFLGGMALLGVIGGACRWLERQRAEQLGQDYVHELRLVMFEALAGRARADRTREGRGAVPLRFISDLNALKQWISVGHARLVVAAVLLVATFVYLATLNPSMAAAFAAVLAFNAAVGAAVGRRLEDAVTASRRLRGRLAALTAEKASNMEAVVGFGRLRSETARLAKSSRKLCHAMNARAFWAGGLRATSELSVRLAVAAVIAVSLLELETHRVTPGELLAAVSLVALIVTPVRDLGRVHEYFQAAKASRRKIESFIETADTASG